jgi:hypothetical protein
VIALQPLERRRRGAQRALGELVEPGAHRGLAQFELDLPGGQDVPLGGR